MFSYQQYRPPGRSNRSGRSNADNDVFEGLPVKQWGQSMSRVSLAPPVMEVQNRADDKWADPPMPRDYQMLQPFTQHLLRLARSGRVGTKRKQDHDNADEEKPEDEPVEEANKDANIEDRGYVAKKWKPVPEHLLEPEHKHFEFLAKRRKGLPSLYGPDQQSGAPVVMRRTKVQKANADGEVAVYEVLVPEGQTMEGEVTESTELADVKPVVAAPGTVIEGVGIANEEGVVVAEHLKPTAPRRNRPPPKKKGGPGRGKKRVTFTNPDGSTYTTVVPNATKIVPQPGQTVKHVAKGEEAGADVTAEQAAAAAPEEVGEGGEDDGEDGSGSDDGDDDDDDDREDGELSDGDANETQIPVKAEASTTALENKSGSEVEKAAEGDQVQNDDTSDPMEGIQHERAETAEHDAQKQADREQVAMKDETLPDAQPEAIAEDERPQTPSAPAHEAASAARDMSSSPERPLANNSGSRSGSRAEPSVVSSDDPIPSVIEAPAAVTDKPAPPTDNAMPATAQETNTEDPHEPALEDGPAAAEEPEKSEEAADEDLLGNLERELA